MTKIKHFCKGLTPCLLLILALSGCIFQPVEELYHLPMQSVEYEQLTSAISTIRSALELSTPGVEYANIISGDHTSTIQLQNLSQAQEVDTAITFFRAPSADTPMKIFIFDMDDEGNYVPHCVIEGSGTSILSVDFAELNGMGKKEIIINWQNNQLGVYSLDSTPKLVLDTTSSLLAQIPEATELLTTSHSSYALTDMNNDGLTDLSVIRLDSTGANSYVELFLWAEGALSTYGIAPLSETITSLSAVRVNFVRGNIPALYVSANLLDNTRTTDIIALSDDRLSNLTLDSTTNISTQTLRDYREIVPTDINGDGILEIPEPHPLPSDEDPALSTGTTFWLVDWVQYDLDGKSTPVFSTYHNISDGWYLIVPTHWKDKISISRDDSILGQRTVIFSRWNGTGNTTTPFLAIYKLTGPNRYTRAALTDRFELGGDSATIYAATFIPDGWDCGLTEPDVIKNFSPIISSWS